MCTLIAVYIIQNCTSTTPHSTARERLNSRHTKRYAARGFLDSQKHKRICTSCFFSKLIAEVYLVIF